jgi:hypothetical protein
VFNVFVGSTYRLASFGASLSGASISS